MFVLIKGAHIYAPEDLGIQDILICHDKIIKIAPQIAFEWDGMQVIDAAGKLAFPGFMDQHVHITGGGGESGFKSRITDIRMTDCIKSGVTTVVGLLGTDSTSRSVENLVAKAKGLTEEGITAYCLTGAYNYPSPTLTGSVAYDVAFIPEILGVKLCITDHRSSHVTRDELARLATEVRKAALLAGKAGIVHMHTGKGKIGLQDVIDLIEESDIPISHFRPTHCGNLTEDAIRFGKLGGRIDFTTGSSTESCAKTLNRVLSEVDSSLITLSSDSNGSMPVWNEKNEIIGMGVGKMTTLYDTVKAFILKHDMPICDAVSLITRHVAEGLRLYPSKGCLAAGADADICLVDEKSLALLDVLAKGQIMMLDTTLIAKDYYQY